MSTVDKSLIARVDAITAITERDSASVFHVFDDCRLEKIAAGMPEIHRATRVFGRKNTQSTNRLMTLTMLADASPYRVLRQCLAQIENKRTAIRENRFRLMKDQVRLEKYRRDLLSEPDEFSRRLLEIKIKEKKSAINESILYIEGALKELASFQSSYQQICRNKNIPESWDEEDMEKAEVAHHLRMAFLHAYRDIMAHGRLGMGTLEYLQQFGVHPQRAFDAAVDYIKASVETTGADYEHLETWLDRMVEKNRENYRQVLNRIGIDTLYETWYQYKENGGG